MCTRSREVGCWCQLGTASTSRVCVVCDAACTRCTKCWASYWCGTNAESRPCSCAQVLAFPCNQFGSQEPGTCAEVKKFASTMYDADFPIFDKVRDRVTHPCAT